MTQSWDLIVIGGGSGGLACAQRAARHGARVAIAEPGHLGGTCVNAGCVPKKIMFHAADLAHALVDTADYGFSMTGARHDWAALKARRDAYVERLRGIYQENLDRSGAQLIRARARLAGAGRIEIGSETHEARHIVIATGGAPLVPELPGAVAGTTSDGFFALERMPASVAIVGSGYVAAELSGVFAALGARVTLAIRYDRVLRAFDEMLSERLMEAMRADGIEIAAHALPTAIESSTDGHRIRLSGGHALGPFDCVIWAIGRAPMTAGLGLAEAGVILGPGGEVATDLRQDTNVAGIHAIGDVTGRFELTPVAIAAGRRLADRLFGGEPERHLDYRLIPTVVFSHPPVGTVGLSESDARVLYGDSVSVFRHDFMPLYHGITARRRRAEVKLVTAHAERRIVGLHAIGMGADELLQGFAVALRLGATKHDFDDTVAIHPTSAEELVTLTG
ncbi:MAG: glutathione-disulfide reductase [Steroidobacteraceae bacterium]